MHCLAHTGLWCRVLFQICRCQHFTLPDIEFSFSLLLFASELWESTQHLQEGASGDSSNQPSCCPWRVIPGTLRAGSVATVQFNLAAGPLRCVSPIPDGEAPPTLVYGFNGWERGGKLQMSRVLQVGNGVYDIIISRTCVYRRCSAV